MDESVDRLATAASRLLESSGPHRASLQFDFDDPRRLRWTYLPGVRHGVPLAQLDRDGAKAVHGLLAATLSHHAHVQVAAIMGLEDPLGAADGRDRHAGDYWVAIHGNPADTAWSWRLGGHHVSVRTTVADGRVRPTPLFLGANPARVEHAGVVTSRPLAPEEELAFQLLAVLPERHLTHALVDRRPPDDIVTGDALLLDDLPPTAGVRLADLDREARRVADDLVAVYLDRLAAPLRRHYLDDVVPHIFGDLRFAWAGGRPSAPRAEDRPGHYYRIAGPRFLAELDNTQNGANHVHTVWRDPAADHGRDLR
ncbi:DUF3500 domain-containing protein [Egicoccus sp. AB-alg6-2]|uniref:DUF3500 domain-containing protein n=1 Tax=Egicoccus sp. AB-alg6-2 TaxID=3242692 RepID=UPI00359E2B93